MERLKIMDQLVKENEDKIIEWRRHLHQNPELSFEEFETSEFIAEKLGEMGLDVKTHIGGTGIVATLDTGKPGPVIAFRADMDALPISEATELPYESRRGGVMHACGHDMHMSVLLGTAQVLTQMRDELKGTVKFIFQPGEEANGGARCMINGGALKNPDVESIFALHCIPEVDTGVIGIKDGYLSATDDQIVIRVHGVAAHSSEPEAGVNAIMIAANILTTLQSIRNSNVNPFDVSTFTICKIHGGDADNVLADNVEMAGMVRCVEKKTKMIYRERIKQICEGCAAAMGGTVEIDFIEGFLSVYNDPSYTKIVEDAAKEVLAAPQCVFEIPKPHLGSEDFSNYQEVIPGVIFMLGVGMEGEDRGSLHTPTLNPHEDALGWGIKIFANTAFKICGK